MGAVNLEVGLCSGKERCHGRNGWATAEARLARGTLSSGFGPAPREGHRRGICMRECQSLQGTRGHLEHPIQMGIRG